MSNNWKFTEAENSAMSHGCEQILLSYGSFFSFLKAACIEVLVLQFGIKLDMALILITKQLE